MADAGSSSKSEADGSKAFEDPPLRPNSASSSLQTSSRRLPAASAFAFWAYLAAFVALLALLLPYPAPSGDHSWFLSFPDDLRLHHARGKFIKAQAIGAAVLHVFAVEDGPPDGDAVLLVHGLGSSSFSFRRVLPNLASTGHRAVAIDLPGSGFSDPFPDGDSRLGGALGWILDVYKLIKEKGIFWGFDHLVQTGEMPYDQIGVRVSGNDGSESSAYSPADIGRVIGQVIESMGLAPVNLVLHDSATPGALSWASANPGLVGSVTLVDSSADYAAFPSWFLGTPVLGPLLLRSRFMFSGLLKLCCSRSMDGLTSEAYRLMLKANDRKKAIVEAGKALNYSFDLGEWTRLEAMKDVPLQVLWSNMWSDRWIDEGKRISAIVQHGKFAYHSGGRWPQEDVPEEISGLISQFLSSLPKRTKKIKEEPIPEHIQRLFDEATDSHHHHHHSHGHGDDHAMGFANMYGVDQGWDEILAVKKATRQVWTGEEPSEQSVKHNVRCDGSQGGELDWRDEKWRKRK